MFGWKIQRLCAMMTTQWATVSYLLLQHYDKWSEYKKIKQVLQRILLPTPNFVEQIELDFAIIWQLKDKLRKIKKRYFSIFEQKLKLTTKKLIWLKTIWENIYSYIRISKNYNKTKQSKKNWLPNTHVVEEIIHSKMNG